MTNFQLGDEVVTRKKHPCGGDRWEIIRTGADVKIKCKTCGRIVMLDLTEFRKRVKKIVRGGDEIR